MNLIAGTTPVPLTVFGGAIPEMSPEDIPEGGSPFCQDTDFSPGSVFTRAGRQNVYTFGNLFAEDLGGVSINVVVPNETAWTNPPGAINNIPGSPASVALNTAVALTNGTGLFDQAVTNFGTGTAVTTPSITPANATSWALFLNVGTSGLAPTPVAGWSNYAVGAFPFDFAQYLGTNNPISGSATYALSQNWVAALLTFAIFGNAIPTLLQDVNFLSGAWNSSQTSNNFANLTAGSTVIIVIGSDASSGVTGMTVTDSLGNVYTRQAHVSGTNCQLDVWVAQNVIGGAVTENLSAPIGGPIAGANWRGLEIKAGTPGAPSNPISEPLQITNFGFNIPVTDAVLGFQIEVTGSQTVIPVDAILQASIVNPGPIPILSNLQLPLVAGQVKTPIFNWNLVLTPALLNNPAFGVILQAFTSNGEAVTFNVSAVRLKAFLSPNPPANFNWIKTYEQTSGQIDTLALDNNGILWDENVTSALGVLNSIFTAINPGSFGKSETFNNIEYIALSNLIQGTDIPRQWNGTNLDRVSQVGPGAPPVISTSSNGASVVSITQTPAKSNPEAPGFFSEILWSAGPGNSSPGNVLTLYYARLVIQAAPDPNLVAGGGVVIAGAQTINGQPVNGTYTIVSVGHDIPPQAQYDRWYFTVQMPTSQFFNTNAPPGAASVAGTYQVTLATLTVSAQVPFLEVGNQFTLTGVTPAGWNNTFVVQGTPNASQLQITQTSLTGGIAQYVFNIITGTAPVVGQFVTVVGTLNGNGEFNVVNQAITAVTPNTFSITLVGPNVNASAETGNGIISGTIFTFDPAFTITPAIPGNAGPGGTIATAGVIGVGIRNCVCIFQTRNGALTQTSPPIQFNVTIATSAIVAAQIPIGPPDTVKRILAFTGANGGNYFYIPAPVTVISNSQPVTYTSTVINDNTTTQVTLSFPDAVLLASTAIDIPGNNLFNQMELGSSRGFLTYASRLIAWGEQNKIQNLLNLSFDGGISPTNTPLGWTVDPVNGGGVQVLVSPIFGNSFYVQNLTGGVQALYGMISQSAFQDAFQVPIVLPATTYSVRVTARSPSGAQTGAIVFDLFSPKLKQQFGSFTIPLSSLTSNMQILTGTLLTTAFSTIPKDLQYRIYGTNIPNNGDFEIDRTEPFPTIQPVFSTQLRASYANNPEAFDLVTGAFGPAQNQQPINGAFTQFETLYALKEKSFFSTSDNGVTEPFKWNWREVSKRVGTIGQNSYDAGEEWMTTADRAGVHFFEGGEPLKISQEIQPVWDSINWKFGYTIWVRNDPEQRRLTIGVPIPTPNPFMPEFPVNANPTSPNVILMCSYRELNSGAELARTGPIRSTFSGRLMSPEPARKWSFWNIASPYSDFIDRGNNQWPQFYCNGYQNSKVYQLSDAELDDDGNAINSFWISYGFVKPEMADAKGLGLFRMEFDYMTMLLVGQGNALVQVYPESVQNVLPYQIGSVPLQAFSQGDVELPVNIKGNRFFVRIGSNAVGSKWRLSKIVAALVKDAWSEIRGTTVGSA